MGATRYGLETGGIHHRIFSELEINLRKQRPVIPLVRFIYQKQSRLTFVRGEGGRGSGSGSFPVVNRFGSCWQLCSKPAGPRSSSASRSFGTVATD